MLGLQYGRPLDAGGADKVTPVEHYVELYPAQQVRLSAGVELHKDTAKCASPVSLLRILSFAVVLRTPEMHLLATVSGLSG